MCVWGGGAEDWHKVFEGSPQHFFEGFKAVCLLGLNDGGYDFFYIFLYR